jgi:Ca2+-dependent lipid-binding protein
MINQVCTLQGDPDLKKEYNAKDFGTIYIQGIFLAEGQSTTELPKELENYEAVKLAATLKGSIEVFVRHAKGLMKGDETMFGGKPTSSDPYVKLTWPERDSVKTYARQKTVTPIWNELKVIGGVVANTYNLSFLQVEVYDEDTMSSDILGKFNLDMKPCIDNPGKWAIDQNFKLEGTKEWIEKKFKNFGEIYLQARFVKEGDTVPEPIPEPSENIQEVLLKSIINGQFFINAVWGKSLPVADSGLEGSLCDPYLEIIMPDKKVLKTKSIENTLNPIWKQNFVQKATLESFQLEPIQIQIKDKDSMLVSDDLIGYVQYDISEAVQQSGKWSINRIIDVGPPSEAKGKEFPDKKWGSVYLQIKWLKDGDTDDPALPTEVEDLAKTLATMRRDGTFEVYIVHGQALLAVEGKFSDPLCIMNVNGTEYETQYIDKTTNPIWDAKKTTKVLGLESEEFLRPVKFTVKDHNSVMSNESLGEVTVDFKPLLNASGKWLIDEVYKLTGTPEFLKKKGAKLGEVYVQARWLATGSAPEVVNAPRPALKVDMKAVLAKARVWGKVLVYAAHATGMIYVEKDGTMSDAFAEFKIGTSESVKAMTKENST